MSAFTAVQPITCPVSLDAVLLSDHEEDARCSVCKDELEYDPTRGGRHAWRHTGTPAEALRAIGSEMYLRHGDHLQAAAALADTYVIVRGMEPSAEHPGDWSVTIEGTAARGPLEGKALRTGARLSDLVRQHHVFY